MTVSSGIASNQVGEVDSRSSVGRNLPGCRDLPVAAVSKTHARIAQASRLYLRQMYRRRNCGDLTRTHAAVVTHAIDIDGVCGRRSAYLKKDRSTLIDTDVGGKALDGWIADAAFADVPLAGRIARQAVFCHDCVC